MIRIIIGILIWLLIGTYFGIRLQVSDLAGWVWSLTSWIGWVQKTLPSTSSGYTWLAISDGTQISETLGNTATTFFKSAEFDQIVQQIKANPSQTQIILQQSLTSLATQMIKQKLSQGWLSSLTSLLSQ